MQGLVSLSLNYFLLYKKLKRACIILSKNIAIFYNRLPAMIKSGFYIFRHYLNILLRNDFFNSNWCSIPVNIFATIFSKAVHKPNSLQNTK